jgi:hypothetical protein
MALISGETDLIIAEEAPLADAVPQTVRLGPYGEQVVLNAEDAPNVQALSGARYQALTVPAVSPAGVAMGIQTTFSDTANIAFILVNGSAAGGKRVVMDYVKVRITAAGSTTTAVEAAIEIDTTNRYSSGGTALAVANATTETNQASVVSQCKYAAVTATAAGGSRKWLWHALIRKAAAPVWIVGDTIHFNFGEVGEGSLVSAALISSTDANGTAFARPVPPAVIGPGGSLLLHIANVANATTAPSILVEAGWHEL